MFPKKHTEFGVVTKFEVFAHDQIYIECKLKRGQEMVPGQFLELLITDNPKVFLRRPFSIHDWQTETGILSLWIKIVGNGTTALAKLKTGSEIDMVLPLGKGFTLPESGKVLLAGGGCGAAPLLFLARKLSQKGIDMDILLGAKYEEDIIYPEKYSVYGNTEFIFENGTYRKSGLITEHPLIKERLSDYSCVFVCGPQGMLKAVGKKCLQRSVECEVSLENLMACGVGACLCCVVQSDKGHVCTCTDGPVFNVNEISKWIMD